MCSIFKNGKCITCDQKKGQTEHDRKGITYHIKNPQKISVKEIKNIVNKIEKTLEEQMNRQLRSKFI